MIILLQILFWFSAFALFHSYVLYPLLLKYLTRHRSANTLIYTKNDVALPPIFIVMAVFNEEKVLAQKLDSILQSNYPQHLLNIFIGSDNSTDASNDILANYSQQYPFIRPTIFSGRNGKIRIINQLIQAHQQVIHTSKKAILVLTDANVLFDKTTLWHLAKHFKNTDVGLVGANILNKGIKNSGISFQEKWYIQRENVVKYREGLLDGNMMGAFGACFAMRANLFSPVPPNFIVDDFFLTMQVIDKGKKAIKELEAVCYEDVSDDILEEFRRKKRISAGNFQNLATFTHLMHPKTGFTAFNFFSHKVLRWLGPFFLIIALVSSALLQKKQEIYFLAFSLQIFIFLLPIVDYLLKKQNIHLKLLRFISYFHLMNIALLLGFINYLKGVKTNVWKPTKRNH